MEEEGTKVIEFSSEQEQKEEKKANKFLMPIVLVAVVILAGVLTGYLLVPKGQPGSGGGGVLNSGGQKGKEVGMAVIDESKYDDTVGVLEEGGIDGEGTHKLVREGGPSQTAYLTSSLVNLDDFIGKKVQVWGQTFTGRKAGWFMDVVKVKVIE